MALPIFNVAGSPVDNNGTFTVTFNNQEPNLVLASPELVAGTPDFRALSGNDFPVFPNPTMVLQGCDVIWTGTGLVFNITSGVYVIQNIVYPFAGDTVTLNPADPSNPRIDVIGLDVNGALVVEGVPAADPQEPTIDPSTQIRRTIVTIGAGATEPTDVDQEIIYDENLGSPSEWDATSSGVTVDYDDTTAPFHLTKAASVTGTITDASQLIFTAAASVIPQNFTALTFGIRLNGTMPGNVTLQLQWTLSGTAVSEFLPIQNNQYGFKKNVVDSYQVVSIPIAAWNGFSADSADGLIIQATGTWADVGFRIDYIRLQGGLPSFVPTYSFESGLTQNPPGVVRLGGTLLQATNISGNNNYYLAFLAGRGQMTPMGATVTAANSISLLNDGNFWYVSGTTTINEIEKTNWLAGTEIGLLFTSSVTVTNQATPSSSAFGALVLAGRTDMNAVNGDMLTLRYDGSSWYEIGRSLTSLAFSPQIEEWIADWRKNNYVLASAVNATYKDENKQTVTLSTGENLIHGFIYANGKLWASDMANPNKAYRFNDPDDLTDYDVLQIGIDGNWDSGYDIIYIREKNKLYTVTTDNGGGGDSRIYEIDPTSFTKTLRVDLAASFSGFTSLATDGVYLYALRGNGNILKIDLSDFSYTNTLTLSSVTFAQCLRYDGTHLYASDVSTGRMWKIRPSDMTELTTSDVITSSGITDDISLVGDNIWVVSENTTGNIYVIKKSDLSLNTTISTGVTSEGYGTYFDGKYVWAVFNSSPGTVVRVNPETNELYKFTLATGENSPNEIITDGQRLFITCYLSPAKIVRLSIPILTYVSSQYVNIYNSDGTLTGARTMTMGTNPLTFSSSNVTGATTSSSLVLTANSLTSGSGLYASSTSLSSGSLIDVLVNSTGAASNTQKGLNISLSGANGTASQTSYGVYVSNTHSGTTPANIGVYATISNGSASSVGVYGVNSSSSGAGVRGSGQWGIYGESSLTAALYGIATSSANGVYAQSVNSSAAAFLREASTTNSVLSVSQSTRATTGTATDGIGASHEFYIETDNGTTGVSNQLISKWTTAANATRTSQFIITGVNSAVTNNILTISGAGDGTFLGSIATADPASGSGAWKLGTSQAATVILDTTQYIEIDIGGSTFMLAVAALP